MRAIMIRMGVASIFGLITIAISLACLGDCLYAADYSNWLKNLSAAADPNGLYDHNSVKIAVSGSYVHVVWVGNKKDSSGRVLFYRRSADSGVTFDNPRQLAQDSPGDLFGLELKREWRNVVADSPYVYIIYTVGWPNKLTFLRSGNNGTTFDNPVVWNSDFQSYAGVFITAENGKMAAGWAANKTDSPHSHGINCQYSDDGGATIRGTVVGYVDDNNPRSIDGHGITGFELKDAIRSGNNVYLLTADYVGDYGSYFGINPSNDGGKTFLGGRRLNLKASNGNYYAPATQDVDYSANLAASGNDVHAVWVNYDALGYDGWASPTLRVAKSSDAGNTFSDSVILYKYADGYQPGAQIGLETIWRNGKNVYVVTCGRDWFGGTYLWRSTDAGVTWGKMQQLSTGGWWPHVQVDPSNASKVHVVNGSYFLSGDGGATFNGGANPHYNFNDWWSPQFAVGPDGAAHYAGQSGSNANSYDHEIFYRRIAAEPSSGTVNKAVSLIKAADGKRRDNIQIPATPDINFSSAMTAEIWVKRTSDDPHTFQPFLIKKRLSGWESYSIGTWNDFQIYARLTTDKATGSIGLGSMTTLNKGMWTHIALTYDASAGTDNMRLYVNGMLAGKTTVTGNILTDTMDSPLVIGRDDVYYDGEISVDDLRLWNRARTPAEIVANLSTQLAGNESGLAAYYTFNDTFRDITGHGNDGIPMYQESFVAAGKKPPYVTSLFPAAGVINVNPNTSLAMAFNEVVAKGTGDITITMPQGSSPEPIFETIPVTSSKVVVIGSRVTIKTTNPLTFGRKFYVTMPATCFKNANGDNFQGITSTISWIFTTGAVTKKDLIGTWAGQGIFYRNSDTKAWIYVTSAASQIAAGDMDGDGKDDLVGLWSDGVWAKYSSTGNWFQLASAASWIAVGDMNGDGNADLIGNWNSVIYLRDSSNGTWTALTSGASKVYAADIDGDGKADLIGQWDSGIWILLSSSGQWQRLSSAPDWFAVGDLNGDGRADFVGLWGTAVWICDSATGTWSNPTSGASKVTLGDLDGDGKADLIGQWPDGIWVKYSSTDKWEWLSSAANWFTTGRLR